MLAAAEATASGAVTPSGAEGGADAVADFLTTGRTGRRNAMPDILGANANVSVGDLPDCLGKLSAGSEATTPCTSTGVTHGNPFGPSTSRGGGGGSDLAPSGPTGLPGPSGSVGGPGPSGLPGPDPAKS